MPAKTKTKTKPKTIAVYKSNIQQLEAELNDRLSSEDYEALPEVFRSEMEVLRKLKPKSRSLKSDYKRYESELKYAIRFDTFTQTGKRLKTEKEIKAWHSLRDNVGGGLSYQTWRKMVNTFGSVGIDILERFYGEGAGETVGGSGALTEIYKAYARKGKNVDDIQNALVKVEKDSHTDEFKQKYGVTSEGLIDALRDELGFSKRGRKPKR